MSDLQIRPADPSEASAITDLALASKAVWGYDAGFMAAVRDELTVAADRCDGERVWVAADGTVLRGFYELGDTPVPSGRLESLFVAPDAIGTGLGGRLLDHARAQARELGYEALEIDSDPYAEAFYLHEGAVRTGQTPSGSIPGRELPRLEIATAP